MDRSRLRASDADREQVIDALKAAFVQGMLTMDELDMRAGRALVSRTNAELAAITADIPASLIEIQPPSKPVQACAAKRVNKKVVAWGACVIVLLPALGTAFLTYYGGFLVLLVFAFIGTMAASPTASRQLGRPSDLDLCTWSRSPNIPDAEAVTWSVPSRPSGIAISRRYGDGCLPQARLPVDTGYVLELRPNCECCDRDLGPESPDVFICSYECTWCLDCAENVLHGVCPNCSGELVRRPIRPAHLLAVNPPSTERVVRPGCAPASAR